MSDASSTTARILSRILQADDTPPDNEEEEGNFTRFTDYLFFYILLLFCCVVPYTICEWRRRRHRERIEERLAYLNRMASNGVDALGTNVPDAQDADERRLEAKMGKIDAATQGTTLVVTSKDLVAKPDITLVSAPTDSDETLPPNAASREAGVITLENIDLEDGEQFAALRLPCDHPNAKSREVPSSCAICLCSYEVGDSVTFSPNESCQHAFHKECITAWMARKKQPLCPCCRQEFCSLEQEEEES